jgi:hypothetical protein
MHYVWGESEDFKFFKLQEREKGEKKGRVSTNQRAPVSPKHQAAMVHSALGENSKT